MVRVDSVDLTASRSVCIADEAVGVGLIARRGWTSRLAGMAIVASVRRQGLGRILMDRLTAESRTRGERAMLLEVIEQNSPAVRLYAACGFLKLRRLVGFAGRSFSHHAPANEIAEVDVGVVAEAVRQHAPSMLPWQLSGETIAMLTPPTRAFATTGAWLADTPVSDTQMSIRALVSASADDAIGSARNLLAATMAQFPGMTWRMTAVWPEEQSTLFQSPAFDRLALTQWQMIRPLIAAASPVSGAA